MGPITIRMMSAKDVGAIADIDNRVLGKRRRDYWEMKVESAQARSPVPPLVAEVDGRVAGFIMGDASGWHHGVARALMDELVTHMKKVGVTKIYTLVNWRDWDILRFFDKLGFTRGDMINLELKV